MEQQEMKYIKHSGAGWLIKILNVQLTPLEVKVANVLGQVFHGIYHIDEHVLNRKNRWGENILTMMITVHGSMSTYDDSKLFMLYAACQKAEISVEIHGSFKGYTRFLFMQNPGGSEMVPVPAIEQSSLDDCISACCEIKRKIEDVPDGKLLSAHYLPWHYLIRMIYVSHRSCSRFQVQGRSPNTLEIMASKRRGRQGFVWERHPTLEEHSEILRPLWDIDYQSIK